MMSRFWFVGLSLLLSLGFVGDASAKSKSKKVAQATPLNEALGDVKWGDAKKDILAKLRKVEMDRLRADESIRRDQLLLQRERKALMDRLAAADKSYTRLEGRTGYEVSVIADEFTSNNGESFMVMKDKVAQRFYFFIDGKFYKLVVGYNPSYMQNVGFESLVGSTVNKYGRPAVAEYDQIGGKEQLGLVQWEDPETILAVKNKKELFDTYTMVFTDRQALRRLEASNRKFGGGDKSEEEVSAAVKALTESGNYEANANVLDSLVGRTDVNLNEGRPQDDKVRRFAEEEEQVAAKGKTKAKAAPAKKKAPKKTKKGPDFKDLATGASDDLIIY